MSLTISYTDDIEVVTEDMLDTIIREMNNDPSTAVSHCGWSDKDIIDAHFKHPELGLVFFFFFFYPGELN